MSTKPKLSLWAVLGPGLLLAATGVGGGDLATATFVGGVLGTAVLWAIAVGAFMNFVVR
jgi:Mn2+/Fe2+ NRAMP family transporter